MDNGNKESLMDLEYIFGQMAENILVIGNEMQCMEEEFTNGMMAESTMDNMWWIKKKDLENIIGQMVNYIKDSGKMGSSQEMES